MKGQPLNKILLGNLYEAHTKGRVISDLARENDMRPATLYYALKRLGPITRGWKNAVGDSYKLWPILTREAAYIYGLWSADGHMNNDAVHIKLHKADRYLLEYIKEFLGANNLYPDADSFRLVLHQGRYTLPSTAFPYRKTEVGVPIPALSDDLYRHYVRGYFDGDGSVCRRKSRPNQIQLYWCSPDREFLVALADLLPVSSRIYTEGRAHLGYRDMHTLRVLRQADQILLFEWMYHESEDFKMLRKYNFFASYVNTVLTGKSSQ